MITIITRLIFLLLFTSQTIAFNLSHFIFPTISDEFRPQQSQSLFLKDVIEAISYTEHWKPDEIKVSKLEIEKVRYGNLKRYEIEFLLGDSKKDFVFNLRDEVLVWRRFQVSDDDFEVLANQVSLRAVVGSVRVDGPVELIVSAHDDLKLLMPWNASHAGLKRILVGEGVTVEVRNAKNVSVLQALDIGNQKERNFVTHWEQCNQWFFPCLICMSVLPVRIFGSASVVAFGTQNPSADITSNIISENVIELLPDICYAKRTNKKQQFPIASLRPKIKQLEKILKSFLGDRINRNASGAKLNAKIEASTAFRFQLEIERSIRINDTRWNTMAEWRTRPTVERVWFEVLARIERKRLKPISFKKIKPFVGVDSSAWSNLMANMSFTKLSSVLVAPEALTM